MQSELQKQIEIAGIERVRKAHEIRLRSLLKQRLKLDAEIIHVRLLLRELQ